MNEILKSITHQIKQIHGIDISKYDEAFLNKTLLRRQKETLCKTEATYYSYLEQSRIESDIFLNSLQISYTEFFRNTLTFSVLEKIILPSIILKKGKSNRNEIRTPGCLQIILSLPDFGRRGHRPRVGSVPWPHRLLALRKFGLHPNTSAPPKS